MRRAERREAEAGKLGRSGSEARDVGLECVVMRVRKDVVRDL